MKSAKKKAARKIATRKSVTVAPAKKKSTARTSAKAPAKAAGNKARPMKKSATPARKTVKAATTAQRTPARKAAPKKQAGKALRTTSAPARKTPPARQTKNAKTTTSAPAARKAAPAKRTIKPMPGTTAAGVSRTNAAQPQAELRKPDAPEQDEQQQGEHQAPIQPDHERPDATYDPTPDTVVPMRGQTSFQHNAQSERAAALKGQRARNGGRRKH